MDLLQPPQASSSKAPLPPAAVAEAHDTPRLAPQTNDHGVELAATATPFKPSFTVLSGGTGCNALVGAFLSLGSSSTFVIPISDSGGSSSEIIRVCGGPSIGDIRSRLIRLIPTGPNESTASSAIRNLFEYRLSAHDDADTVKKEWLSIVEGRHRLWRGIPSDRREVIRAFLVHFEHAVLKRAHRRFNFRNASVGNCWLSAAQMFLRSLSSAIFLFTSITGIPDVAKVVPVINTSSVATIAAELRDSSVIVGQCEISHPAARSTPTPDVHSVSLSGAVTPSGLFAPDRFVLGDDDDTLSMGDAMGDDDHEIDDDVANEPETGNLVFSKADEAGEADLPSPINRIYYINQFGQEIFPRPNPSFIASLSSTNTLVYSCGSLYTSIMPCLTLRGVGRAIAASPALRYKVLLLNSTLDRETRTCTTAVDFVMAIAEALNRSEPQDPASTPPQLQFRPSDFITHILYLQKGEIAVDKVALRAMGIEPVRVEAATKKGQVVFDETNVQWALASIFGS